MKNKRDIKEELWEKEMDKIWESGKAVNFSYMHDVCMRISSEATDKVLEEKWREIETRGKAYNKLFESGLIPLDDVKKIIKR